MCWVKPTSWGAGDRNQNIPVFLWANKNLDAGGSVGAGVMGAICFKIKANISENRGDSPENVIYVGSPGGADKKHRMEKSQYWIINNCAPRPGEINKTRQILFKLSEFISNQPRGSLPAHPPKYQNSKSRKGEGFPSQFLNSGRSLPPAASNCQFW